MFMIWRRWCVFLATTFKKERQLSMDSREEGRGRGREEGRMEDLSKQVMVWTWSKRKQRMILNNELTEFKKKCILISIPSGNIGGPEQKQILFKSTTGIHNEQYLDDLNLCLHYVQFWRSTWRQNIRFSNFFIVAKKHIN